jgi:hypothetical protein
LGSEAIAKIERRTRRNSIRTAAGIIGAFDAVAWLLLAATYYWSDSEPATKDFDEAAAAVTTALFVVTGAPALVLAARARAPRAALILALGFPTVFLILLVAVAYTLP